MNFQPNHCPPISVIRAAQVPTYAGLLCGRPNPKMNQHLLDTLPQKVRNMLELADDFPVHFANKTATVRDCCLPQWIWAVELEECAEARMAAAFLSDELLVSEETIRIALAEIDWTRSRPHCP